MKTLLIFILMVISLLFGCNPENKHPIPFNHAILSRDTVKIYGTKMISLDKAIRHLEVNEYSDTGGIYYSLVHFAPDTVFIHDTINANMDAVIKPLLLNYYKAGWVAATNRLINLYADDKFSSKNIYDFRSQDWKKMEQQINSK